MKVYFEETGFGDGEIDITVYVKPRKDGAGHHYDAMGNLFEFWWAEPDDALVIEHKLIPKHLWYAFRYGEAHWTMDAKYKFTIDNVLKYAKCSKRTIEQVRAERKLKNTIINNEQDIINILPLIDKCKYIPHNISARIFEIANMNKAPIINGEIGIASFYNTINLSAYLNYLRKKS